MPDRDGGSAETRCVLVFSGRNPKESDVAGGLSRKLVRKVDEEVRFIKGLIDGPKAVGAIAPTSSITARRMASIIDPTLGGPILELGPGTGVITRAILERGVEPSRLTSIEYSRDFYERLVVDFPGVNFIHGDAFRIHDALSGQDGVRFDAIVSGVPLLNVPTPQRVKYIEELLDLVRPGGAIVQISYGPLSPVPPGKGNYSVEPLDWIVRNLPPARLWVYRKAN